MAVYEKWATIKYGTLTVGKDDVGHDVKFYGATSGVYLLWDESAGALVASSAALGTGSLPFTNLFLASGAVIDWDNGDVTITHSTDKLTVASTWTADAIGRPFGVNLTLNVTGGNYVNALKGYVDCSTNGKTIGLLSAVNMEIKGPTGNPQGGYYPCEIEFVGAAGAFGAAGTGTHVGFFWIGATGTRTTFNSVGSFMNINGLTAGATNMLSLDSQTLRCSIDDGTKTRYLVMSIAENYLSHYFSVIAADDRIFKLAGLWATPGNSDGEGIVNISANITGTTAGEANLCSAWLNLDASAEILTWSHLHTDGFYDTSATLGGGHLAWAKYSVMLNSDPEELFIMDLNMVGANSEIDAIYNVNNPALALGYAGTAAATAVGSIPFFSTGGVKKYIMLYATPS